jgi:beta-mannosidase
MHAPAVTKPQPSQSLDGAWTLHGGPGTGIPARPDDLSALTAMPATVPGNVELALQAAGLAGDPLVAPGTWDYIRFETWAWWYERSFDCDLALLAAWRTELVLDGLDCIGSVWLNGVHLGDTANALIAHRLDATAALRPGANRLCIRVSSGIREAREAGGGPVATTHQTTGFESLRLRKAAHQFGWDIMPRLVSAGLWRGVRLEAVPRHAVTDAYWTTLDADAAQRSATVVVDWSLRLPDEGWERWSVHVSLDGAEVARAGVCAQRGRRVLRLRDLDLWWPRGWGEARLHDARIELRDASGACVHAHTARIGIRSVRLRRSEALDGAGNGDFALIVNGQRLYARGTNWVPLDALHSRDGQHLDAALAMLAELGCNTVRMWGGNVYESEAFYDWCDANGMLVWQDFGFGCGVYPQDDAFAAVVADEAVSVVRRLRNRPSVALWCGSNETDQAMDWAWPGLRLDPNRDRITRRVLAQAVADHDPARDYLPSSPYLSPAVHAGGGQPEDHLWGPRDDFKGAYYTASPARFVSEIGYHGCPSRASLERMLPPGNALWPFVGNTALLPLAVKPLPGEPGYDYRIALTARQAAQLIGREPQGIDELIAASQLSQAEALKFHIERWRAGKGRTGGLLWWNLRDGWPIISDAVVDWYGGRKLAYGVIRACQQDVVVLVEEAVSGAHRVLAVNDGLRPLRLSLAIDRLGGSALWSGDILVPANATTAVCHLPAVLDAPQCWRLRWQGDAAGTNHYIAGARPWLLELLTGWYRELGLGG